MSENLSLQNQPAEHTDALTFPTNIPYFPLIVFLDLKLEYAVSILLF